MYVHVYMSVYVYVHVKVHMHVISDYSSFKFGKHYSN